MRQFCPTLVELNLANHIVASRSAGAQSVPVNRLVVGSIPTRGNEIFIYIYILISSLWCRGESLLILTLGSLCLPCCVRGTA